MILKMCACCGKLVEYPNRYCAACQEKVKSENEERQKLYDKRYNQKRNKKYVKFRKSEEWLMLKEKYLQDLQIKYGSKKYSYKCEDCIEENKKDPNYKIKVAEEVHHIEPIETPAGWIKRLDYYNLRALCHTHHDKKHNRFQTKKGKEK